MRPTLLLAALCLVSYSFATKTTLKKVELNTKNHVLNTEATGHDLEAKRDTITVVTACEQIEQVMEETKESAPLTKDENKLLDKCREIISYVKIWDKSPANQQLRQRYANELLQNERVQEVASQTVGKLLSKIIWKNPIIACAYYSTYLIPSHHLQTMRAWCIRKAGLEQVYVDIFGYPIDTPEEEVYRARNDYHTKKYRVDGTWVYTKSDDEIYEDTKHYPFPDTEFVMYRKWVRNPQTSPLDLKPRNIKKTE